MDQETKRRYRSGIVICKESLEKICNGEKVWEMRSTSWKHRGPLVLMEKDTRRVRAVCNMVDCRLIKKADLPRHETQFGGKASDFDSALPSYQGDLYAYVLKDVRLLSDVYSNHKAGPTRPRVTPKTELAILKTLHN